MTMRTDIASNGTIKATLSFKEPVDFDLGAVNAIWQDSPQQSGGKSCLYCEAA